MQWAQAIHDIAKYFLTGTYEKAFSLEGLLTVQILPLLVGCNTSHLVIYKLSNGAAGKQQRLGVLFPMQQAIFLLCPCRYD